MANCDGGTSESNGGVLDRMKHHTKVLLDAMGLKPGEFVPCEMCGDAATDTHHIESRKMGGSKAKDTPDNLVALCRRCHESAHRYPKEWKERLKQIKQETR